MTDHKTLVQNVAPISGEQLAGMRKTCDLSQRALAEVLNVKQVTIWRWESGAVPVPIPVSLAMLWLVDQAPSPGKSSPNLSS